MKLKTYVVLHDLHYPLHSKKTFNAVLEFIKDVKPAGICLAGDQFDNQEISHHTINQPIYRERAAYQRNTTGFMRDILEPLERSLGRGEKVWQLGNHDDWERQFIESHPELEGIIERPELLKLEQRGWKIIPLGHSYKIGELNVIHGEIVSGIGNQVSGTPAKKALEIYNENVLLGHTHSPQSFSKVSPVEQKKKKMAWVAPCMCEVNPVYLKNRPTSWITGFTVVELRDKGLFNLFPIIVIDGEFSYGGKLYKG